MEAGKGIALSHESALWYHRLAAAGLLSPAYSSLDTACSGVADVRAVERTRQALRISTQDLAARDIYLRADVEGYLQRVQPDDPLEALAYAQVEPHMVEFPGPMHVMCSRSDDRRKLAQVRPHLCSTLPFEGAVLRAGKGVDVCSPEMVVFQMAGVLREPHLVAALICELAGGYALLPPGWVYVGRRLQEGKPLFVGGRLQGDGYVDCEPSTAVENIAEILQRADGLRGHALVEKALEASGDGSASPFETCVDVELQLTRRYGGAGAGRGKLNARVDFDKTGRRLSGGRSYARVDLLLTAPNGKRIGIEPGGVLGHAGRAAMEADYRRRQALEHARIEVIQVSWRQYVDYETWSAICRRVVNHLGKKRQPPSKTMLRMSMRVHQDFCSWDCLRVFPPDKWR